MDINDVIAALETAPRTGADADEPEGSRRIWLSDTLARQMVAALRAALAHSKV